MRKRVLCLCLTLLLLAALLPVSAAGTTLTVKTPSTLPKAGEEFTVTVDISGNPGLCAVQFTLAFDKSVVECTDVKLGAILVGMLSATNPNTSSGAKIAAASVNAKKGDGTLGIFTFKVCKSGDPGFALSEVKFTGENDTKIVPNIAPLESQSVSQPGRQPTEQTPAETPEETQEETPTISFSDMTGHWGAEYVQQAVEMGLFTGYPDGTFKPNATISRADFVTVLWRSAGSPEPKNAAPFTDVPKNAYYAKAVAWAKENGYVDGTSATTFDPTGVLQRQAAMKILYYYNGGHSGMELMFYSQYDKSFTDSGTIAAWAKAPMYWAYYNGIISGMGDGILSPTTSATRAQMAKILVNYLENTANK